MTRVSKIHGRVLRRKQRGFINLLLSGGGYEIPKSLRLRGIASAYLSRSTFTGSGRNKGTFSAWVKCNAGSAPSFVLVGRSAGGSNDVFQLYVNGSGFTFLVRDGSGVVQGNGGNTVAYRDPSAWYHFVFVIDTTETATTDRIKFYVNGVRQPGSQSIFSAQNAAVQNLFVNPHYIGWNFNNSDYSDGYYAEIHGIDGQALGPEHFGRIDPVTGQWVAKKYTGTYGTNGFYLDFKDPTSLSTLTSDKSGNGNNWTANNISLTAGVTYDSMLDVPSGNGGLPEGGNYCTLNVLDARSSTTTQNANLRAVLGATTSASITGTHAMSSGKWYWEVTYDAASTNNAIMIGVVQADTNGRIYTEPGTWYYFGNNGNKYVEGGVFTYGASFTTGNVIGVALDMDAGTLTMYKNGVSQGVMVSGLSGKSLLPALNNGGSLAEYAQVNFGQRPFAYAPPAGFKALCTKNLPVPTIRKGSNHFDVVLASGANIKANSEAVFSGSQFLEWIKDRANSNNHQLIDSVRGLNAVLQSNTTAAETTYSAPSGSSVGWVWKAGASAVANNDGSISSQVSANAQAGFSIVTYTGTGANATVGHGLGVAPKMVIVKRRSGAGGSWFVWHAALAGTEYLLLNTTDAKTASAPTTWNSATPTSTTFSVGTSADVNNNADTYVAYCFAEIPGFSRIGSYTGNGSADGPFVHCGFRPRYVLTKRVDAPSDWAVWDATRAPNNLTSFSLSPHVSNAEAGTDFGDFTANGFKLRQTIYNVSGGTYIFLAFAEAPFKYANAR